MNKRQSALLRIMELEFAAIELNLFLDTHPEDRCALADFEKVSQELMKAKTEFEARYGPLMNFGFGRNQGDTWRWIESPWPWEINFKGFELYGEE
ncbi:MAG: spore coat protein CotJB [Bacillota bacterium]|jgi:spore coat protein JB|nr:spore coat protein CotJB [Bacillota bacterium]MDI9414777.1 spore coat protein CotJB [Bacillota bacterium]NLD12015.1 spore coat protein CotJB [Bacillota bacterium]HAV21704.1 spore coat protein CotJB [Bacillota bacterium]HCD42018.1 spore coat protein CotJB [Bacillota bacterium]